MAERARDISLSIELYMDHHIPGPITRGLERVGVSVLTAEQDGRADAKDPALLSRADEMHRLFFSFDRDLLVEASRRQRSKEHFCGLAYAHSNNITVRQAIDSLEYICKSFELKDVENHVIYLPL